jgi:hypothetical protein
MTTEKEACVVVFNKFGSILVSMIDATDEVLCVLAECIEIFIQNMPFKENIGISKYFAKNRIFP